jgi:transposase
MAQSKSVIVSVKVPIKWEVMTERTKQRLRQIVGRDTRIIRAFLGIIEKHEDILLVGRYKTKISPGKLDELTLTTFRVAPGRTQRISVPHDFKARFPRISYNEMTECSRTAISHYESYLELRRTRKQKVSRPCVRDSSRRIPRWIFSRRFQLINKPTSASNWWLSLIDSLDSNSKQAKRHDRILIPLKVAPFHLIQLGRGDAKALHIFKDPNKKWWVTFAVTVECIPPLPNAQLPKAVLGIDLGIENAACTALVTPSKVRETRFFKQGDKITAIKKYDRIVAELQREADNRLNKGQHADEVLKKLRKLKAKRENIAREYDRVLVRNLLDYIQDLSNRYTLCVAIGKLRGIRNTARRGNFKGPVFRGMIHSWAFARITETLKHGLAQLGWIVEGREARFRAVPEAWTSIICWKCGSKGVRPRQNYFKCPECGHKTNADRNGAINIAGRLITLTDSLHSVRGLGKWDDCVRARKSSRPKLPRDNPRGKSLLSTVGVTSHQGESAVIHSVQTDLLAFSDESELSDDDLAVESTVETLSVVGTDAPALKQEKEARSEGGISSR